MAMTILARSPDVVPPAPTGSGTKNRTSKARAMSGMPSRMKGRALPAKVGFFSLSFPTNRFPMMIIIEEMIGLNVSKSGFHSFNLKTLSQY